MTIENLFSIIYKGATGGIRVRELVGSCGLLLIRQAQVLHPSGSLQLGDVLVLDRTIEAVADRRDRTADLEIDGRGLTLLPEDLDLQVHFFEPGLEHKEDSFSASCAWAKGGVTSFLEITNTKPLTTTQVAPDDKLPRAASKCLVNYGEGWR